MTNHSDKIIPEGVQPMNKQHVYGETQTRSHSARSISAAVAKVLSGDDILIEILLRIDFPTTLVRAVLVCRRWLQHASDPAFLHRFRELHPPRLLGFYVNPAGQWTIPRFVPLLPQPLELTSVIRHASSALDAYKSDNSLWTYMRDCRNGNALIEHRKDQGGSQIGVHKLLCPQRGMAIVPQFPCRRIPGGGDYFSTYEQILSKQDEQGSLTYFYVLMRTTKERENVTRVYTLQDGVWCMHNFKIDQIPRLLLEPKCVLVKNKIYMPAAEGNIAVLDFTALNSSVIKLPPGVEYGHRNTMFSPADDAASVYLIHVENLQLRLWLHNADNWLLVDTICLHEICPSFSWLYRNASLRLKHVGDNAEFVFMEMGQFILCWDVKCRTVRKVYEMEKKDLWSGEIFPFMMIWPPKFPVLKDDPARFSS